MSVWKAISCTKARLICVKKVNSATPYDLLNRTDGHFWKVWKGSLLELTKRPTYRYVFLELNSFKFSPPLTISHAENLTFIGFGQTFQIAAAIHLYAGTQLLVLQVAWFVNKNVAFKVVTSRLISTGCSIQSSSLVYLRQFY